MNTPTRFSGLRRAALATVFLFAAGTLAAEEKPAAKPEVPPSVLKKFDKNKDGVLDETELAKWEAEKAARREKYAREKAEMLEKFDTDKDGKISEEERAAGKLKMGQERTEADVVKAKEKDAKWKAEQDAMKRAETEKAAAEAKEAAAGKKPEDGMPAGEPTMGDSMMMSE